MVDEGNSPDESTVAFRATRWRFFFPLTIITRKLLPSTWKLAEAFSSCQSTRETRDKRRKKTRCRQSDSLSGGSTCMLGYPVTRLLIFLVALLTYAHRIEIMPRYLGREAKSLISRDIYHESELERRGPGGKCTGSQRCQRRISCTAAGAGQHRCKPESWAEPNRAEPRARCNFPQLLVEEENHSNTRDPPTISRGTHTHLVGPTAFLSLFHFIPAQSSQSFPDEEETKNTRNESSSLVSRMQIIFLYPSQREG